MVKDGELEPGQLAPRQIYTNELAQPAQAATHAASAEGSPPPSSPGTR